MTKDSLFQLLVPRDVWRRTTEFAKTVPCRGKARAERRRALRTNARWQQAIQVAAPSLERARQKSIARLKLTAAQHAGRLTLIRKLFGKPMKAA